MLAGVLPKIGVLWGVLARVPTEVSMKENIRKSTFASTLRSTPILESTPASILGSHFGGFPFLASLPGQEVPILVCFQKNPRAHKNKIGIPPPKPKIPPPKTRNFMDIGFPAERTHFSRRP